MSSKKQLASFFATSFYTKPKQLLLQAVLLLLLIYAFLQLTAINAMVYMLGDLEAFLSFNLVLSNLLVYVLVAYFAVSVLFQYQEFPLLTPLPLPTREIASAKLLGSLLLPLSLSLALQIPSLLILLIGRQWIAALKLLLFLPASNLAVALFLLCLLTLVSMLYKFIGSRTAYLVLNLAVSAGVAAGVIWWIMAFSGRVLWQAVTGFDLSGFESAKQSIIQFTDTLHHALLNVPFIQETAVFTLGGLSIRFLLAAVFLALLSCLLYQFAVMLLSRRYVVHGLFENSAVRYREVKASSVKSPWGWYVQRERWVLNAEPYFKMQAVLSMLLAPIAVIVLLICQRTDVLPAGWNLEDAIYQLYFAYGVLLLTCTNNISGTPYSREGNNNQLFATLPIREQSVYLAKVMLAAVGCSIAVAASFIIYWIAGYFTADSVLYLVYMLVLVCFYNLLAPLFDKLHPKTDWENPAEAVKSNVNVIISLLIGLTIPAILMFAHRYLVGSGMNQRILLLLMLVVSVLMTVTLAIGLNRYFKNQEKVNG